MIERKARWDPDFLNAKGELIGNRDLMRKGYDGHKKLEHLHGSVQYVLITRKQTEKADDELLIAIEQGTFTG